jgi:plasmid stability protein
MSESRFIAALVPDSMRTELERSAAEHERSLSGEIRAALRQHLQDPSEDASQASAPAAATTSSAARSAASAERGEARASQLAGIRPSPAAPDGSGPPGGARPKEAV